MAKSSEVVAPALIVSQPIGEFYCCVISARDVLAISRADVRRIEARDIERIVGIQRELKASRVKQIQQYVRNVDATFPTAVILAVSSKHASYDTKAKEIRICREEGVASIIDGQHRIAGLEGFSEEFQLICTIFIDMDLEDKAMTFATINLAQTKVNKSLVYDLYDVQKARSPQKTCHQVARLLNSESESPLRGRIKILGKATGEPLQFITQAAFVERLLQYVSDDPMRDRDAIKRGGMKRLPTPPQGKASRLVLRHLFAAERDDVIADSVWSFFDAVEDRWPESWNSDERGNILNKTQGFAGLMRFFGPAYSRLKAPDGSLGFERVKQVLAKVKLNDRDFTVDNYPPGTSGETKLGSQLRTQAGVDEPLWSD